MFVLNQPAAIVDGNTTASNTTFFYSMYIQPSRFSQEMHWLSSSVFIKILVNGILLAFNPVQYLFWSMETILDGLMTVSKVTFVL